MTESIQKNSERIRSLDLLKFLAIFLVVWGHVIQHIPTGEPAQNPVYRLIYSFHMPLFMAIAGFFAVSVKKYSISKLLSKKGIELLLPAICIGGIVAAVDILSNTPIHKTIHSFIFCIWFLKSLFICYILYYAASSIPRVSTVALVITLILSLFIGFCGVNRMYPCFLFGVLLRHQINFIKTHLVPIGILSTVSFIVLYRYWDASCFGQPSGFHPLVNALMTADTAYFTRNALALALGLSATTACICWAELLFDKTPLRPPALDYACRLGTHTKGIYLLQTLLLEVIIARTVSLEISNQMLFNWIYAPLIAVAVMAVCLLAINILHWYPLPALLFLGDRQPAPPHSNIPKISSQKQP